MVTQPNATGLSWRKCMPDRVAQECGVSDTSFQTIRIQACVDRWRSGDASAANELLGATAERLERLARRMLRGFPGVRASADTNDIFQGAVMRLLNALRAVRPESTADYYRLSALQIRRELLDLARRFRGKAVPGSEEVEAAADLKPQETGDLDMWCRLHEAVEHLPTEEREAFGLTFYHGWSQAQVAELFSVTERTVRRWWTSACLRIREALGGQIPGADSP